jgi:hypothetical protein
LGFHALAGEADDLCDSGFEVVVSDPPGGHSTENLEGVNVSFEESFLPTSCGGAMNLFTRI